MKVTRIDSPDDFLLFDVEDGDDSRRIKVRKSALKHGLNLDAELDRRIERITREWVADRQIKARADYALARREKPGKPGKK